MSRFANLLNAIRFMTIMPVPDSPSAPEPDWMARAVGYFPLVGLGVGLVSATVFVIAFSIWGPVLAALLAVATSIAITGAMHEDGIADTFDSFGGGFTVEKRLLIMKDSRIGTYGSLALGLDIALRVAVLMHLPVWIGAAALLLSHSAARSVAAFVINSLNYAGDPAGMKVSYAEERVRPSEWGFGLVVVGIAAAPLLAMAPVAVIVGIALGSAFAFAMVRWAKRLLGGYTGDVLGASEQMFEIGCLLGVLSILHG